MKEGEYQSAEGGRKFEIVWKVAVICAILNDSFQQLIASQGIKIEWNSFYFSQLPLAGHM